MTHRAKRIEQLLLIKEWRPGLASAVLWVRYANQIALGMAPAQPLTCRRSDALRDHTPIREDVRLNIGLWDLAEAMLVA